MKTRCSRTLSFHERRLLLADELDAEKAVQ
jgi:hypothetical protein